MGKIALPFEKLETKYNVTIWRAIQCAGGFSAVARQLMVPEATPRSWARLPGHVPAEYRGEICTLGGNIFQPEQLSAKELKNV